MPPTSEQITEKPVFDVYGTLLILTFLLVGGATLILRQELVENWGWNIEKTDAAFTKVAVHITQMSKDPDKDNVEVTDTDMNEWKLIKGGVEFPERNFKWPDGYDPLANPVKADQDNLSVIPEAQRNALMKDFSPDGAAPAPTTPAAGAGTTAAPATDKPADAAAPKTDAAAPKAEEKPAEKKADEKPAEK